MLTKHCLQEFILDCQLRRLSPRTVKGYHNNTLNFLIYSEKHYEITEVEEIRTVHIKQYIQYLLKQFNNLSQCIDKETYNNTNSKRKNRNNTAHFTRNNNCKDYPCRCVQTGINLKDFCNNVLGFQRIHICTSFLCYLGDTPYS